MNLVMDKRMQDTINNIEARAQKPKTKNVPIKPQIRISKIPKTPKYYLDMAKKADELNEPYLKSLYLRCAKFAKEGKQKEVVELLETASKMIDGNVEQPEPLPNFQHDEPVFMPDIEQNDIVNPPNRRRMRKSDFIEKPKPKPTKSKYNLRSSNQRQQELYAINNIADFILDYTQKVMHKKEILYNFLLRMYDENKKYIQSSKKFAKMKNDKIKRKG